jgi:hypothetical protein
MYIESIFGIPLLSSLRLRSQEEAGKEQYEAMKTFGNSMSNDVKKLNDDYEMIMFRAELQRQCQAIEEEKVRNEINERRIAHEQMNRQDFSNAWDRLDGVEGELLLIKKMLKKIAAKLED